MTIRERLEAEERERLSPFAARAAQTRGRLRPEPESDTRTAYQRDTDRIIHSKAFRRLMHKTQVFLCPEGDHYRTRMTHTLEVTSIARTIARALRLNEDLTEAAGLGHDLGHTPFGHAGELALSEAIGKPFRHNEQSLRVVEKLENDGRGLNLTAEVREAILCHTGERRPGTLEGQILRYADRIAYINHDIDDAVRAGILTEERIPESVSRVLGNRHSVRINTLVERIVASSEGAPEIRLDPTAAAAMEELRDFMFETVYRNQAATPEELQAREIVRELYALYLSRPELLPPDYQARLGADERGRIVCDYIAGMTDQFALNRYREFFPQKKLIIR